MIHIFWFCLQNEQNHSKKPSLSSAWTSPQVYEPAQNHSSLERVLGRAHLGLFSVSWLPMGGGTGGW